LLSRGNIRSIIGGNLLVLFIGFYCSITFFNHTHILDNGITITHSHPFKSGTGNNPATHQHNSRSLILIHSLNTVLLTAIVMAGFMMSRPDQLPFKTELFSETSFHHKSSRLSFALRAPPCF
jgi:hypothetical protein